MIAPVFRAGVLLDGQSGWQDVHLLHDPRQRPTEPQVAAAARTGIEQVVLEVSDLLLSKQLALVFGMARLAADLAFAGSVAARRRRLDKVRGRRLGGGGRILFGRSQLLLERKQLSPEGINLRLEGINPPLQLPTPWTWLPCLFTHNPS